MKNNTVLKIGTSYCPPCKMLNPIYDNMEERFMNKINFLNVSDDNNYELFEKYSKKFNIRSVPVVIIMDPTENELERITGLNKEEVYYKAIEKYIN